MKSFELAASALILFLTACSAPKAGGSAGEPAAGPAPLAQHEWLRRFLGEWRSEAVIHGGEGAPSETMSGGLRRWVKVGDAQRRAGPPRTRPRGTQL